ncbi:MAG: hypothetical protein GF398_11900 [Chitinivibrionales bacterium]|nr:hypothetical protein [Chitinivibrionales bacterium]
MNRYEKRRQALEAFAAIFLALLIVVALAGFGSYPLNDMGDKLEVLIGHAIKGECTIAKVRVVPWRGLTIHNVAVAAQVNDTLRLKATAPEIKAPYRLIRSLHAYSRLDKDAQSLLSDSAGLPQDRLLHYFTSFKQIRVDKIAARLFAPDSSLFATDDLSFIASINDSNSLSFEAEVKCTRAKVRQQHQLHDLVSRASYGNNRLQVHEFTAGIFEGNLSVTGSIDVRTQSIVSGALKLRDMDLGMIYDAAPDKQGVMRGAVSIDLKLKPSPFALDKLHGAGTCAIRGLYLHDVPLQKTLVMSLFLNELDELRFEKVASEFTLQQDTLTITDLKGAGSPLTITASGIARIDGYFDQNVYGILHKKFVQSLSPTVAATLTEEKGGRRSFTCRVWGTFAQPRIQLEKALYRRAISNVFRDMGREIRNMFNRQ